MSLLMRRNNFPVLSDFMDDLWSDRGLATNSSALSMPAVNISESKDQFRIEVAAPGFDKDDFKVNIENNVLTISSEKQFEESKEEENVGRREFMYGAFQRSFSLPATVDPDKIKAKYETGLLKINIPKKEEAKKQQKRQIDVS